VSTRFASLLIGGLAAFTTPALAAPGGEHWVGDFDEAVELARKQNKDLLVDFTGSDWCIWCKKLDKEVFSEQAFLDAAQKDFVLVALDFPHADDVKAKVPNPDRNKELSEKYEIQGFPTVLLMNPDGEVYAKTGYRPGGAAPYVENLAEIRKTGREALVSTRELLKSFAAADAAGKAAVWEKVMAQFEKLDADSPFTAQLASAVRWGIESDPKNAKGTKVRALKALMGAGLAEDAEIAMARELDPDNREGLLERAVEAQFKAVQDDESAKAAVAALDALAAKGFKDKKVGFHLHLTAARWYAEPLADPAASKRHAEAAKAIGTDDEDAMKALEQLLAG
jgi:thioredoxin-related protein